MSDMPTCFNRRLTLRVERRRASPSPQTPTPPRPGDRSNPWLDGPCTETGRGGLAPHALWRLILLPPARPPAHWHFRVLST